MPAMQVITGVFPTVTIALFTVLAAVPWGLPIHATYILPFVTVAAIHYWTMYHPMIVPPPIHFFAGVATDVFTGSPLGYWGLLFLLAYGLGLLANRFWRGTGFLGLWLWFVGVAATIAVLCWAVASLYVFRALDIWPMVIAASVAIAGFPVIAAVLYIVRRMLGQGDRTFLHRV